ncbi:peptide-methionine (R)-S-oxide reductase MsrB [Celerinatantimonas sp. YJH-8]|uniref:peptide-methionine (R)-S-oxide reductase MsrB n=1 Tax=Celerinatantimonas sp. YJH-8 TaxID=3228714 RepID=UPI0038CB7A17
MEHKLLEKLSEQEWQEQLDPETYRVCRLGETEAPFSGTLLHHKASGFYHCACCDRPLFKSESKFDSGCGWPAFDQPIATSAVKYFDDKSAGMHRIEVRCAHCNAHLGHVFDDGPTVTGARYCINSVAMQFHKPDSTA